MLENKPWNLSLNYQTDKIITWTGQKAVSIGYWNEVAVSERKTTSFWRADWNGLLRWSWGFGNSLCSSRSGSWASSWNTSSRSKWPIVLRDHVVQVFYISIELNKYEKSNKNIVLNVKNILTRAFWAWNWHRNWGRRCSGSWIKQ